MNVTVHLLSPLDVLARRMEPFTVELGEGAMGKDLIPVLSEMVEGQPLIHRAVTCGGIMFLVNKAHATATTPLKEGDRVSVVLRISGI